MNQHQKLAIAALMRSKGDDTARARMVFRGFTDEQMQEQHGSSGKPERRYWQSTRTTTSVLMRQSAGCATLPYNAS